MQPSTRVQQMCCSLERYCRWSFGAGGLGGAAAMQLHHGKCPTSWGLPKQSARRNNERSTLGSADPTAPSRAKAVMVLCGDGCSKHNRMHARCSSSNSSAVTDMGTLSQLINPPIGCRIAATCGSACTRFQSPCLEAGSWCQQQTRASSSRLLAFTR